jgi:hypothetical protein
VAARPESSTRRLGARAGVKRATIDSASLAASSVGATSVPDEEPERPTIDVVASDVQRRLLAAAPVATALVLAVFARDPMFASGLVAVIAAFAVFHVFASRIPDAFERLLTRNLIDADATGRFRGFEANLTRSLNAPGAYALGFLFALFAFARFPWEAGGLAPLVDALSRTLAAGRPLLIADIGAESALGFVLGLVAWRMIVVARGLRQVGNEFVLRIQRAHPDRCGGFRPIGNLCLWNALLVSVPAVFLGAWVVLAPKFGYGTTYLGLHTAFLGVLIVLATLTFIAPLWSIHLRMSADADRLREEVDEVGRTIDRLSKQLLDSAEEQSSDESEALRKKLSIQRDIYRDGADIPTWPVDVRHLVSFGSAQIVPILGLTGLSRPVIDVVASFLASAGSQ